MALEKRIPPAYSRAETTGNRRFRHVANGTSTTRSFAPAGIPGVSSIWADPLYEGPVPGGISDAELVAVRTQYLSGGADEDVDPVLDLMEWRSAIARHNEYDELVLWYEHDLFDQLNLIQLLTWIRAHVPETKPVSLVCIGSYPGRPAFKGLGELAPQELAPLLNTRQRLDDSHYELAERAWDAFRQPTPEPIDELRRGDCAALPFLSAALTRFLQEYPWTLDGLSRTERRLLQLANGGPIDLWDVFPRMHEAEDAYYVTDLSLMGLARQLSETSPALLTLEGGMVSLTDAGRDVLAGRLDRVVACGIDRWLGGVHLTDDDVWRWDDERGRPAARRPPAASR